ncbi:hypothetical protein AB205_0164670, partial [Aquarana catesbeiana]
MPELRLISSSHLRHFRYKANLHTILFIDIILCLFCVVALDLKTFGGIAPHISTLSFTLKKRNFDSEKSVTSNYFFSDIKQTVCHVICYLDFFFCVHNIGTKSVL